jgi:hypothetical protein
MCGGQCYDFPLDRYVKDDGECLEVYTTETGETQELQITDSLAGFVGKESISTINETK